MYQNQSHLSQLNPNFARSQLLPHHQQDNSLKSKVTRKQAPKKIIMSTASIHIYHRILQINTKKSKPKETQTNNKHPTNPLPLSSPKPIQKKKLDTSPKKIPNPSKNATPAIPPSPLMAQKGRESYHATPKPQAASRNSRGPMAGGRKKNSVVVVVVVVVGGRRNREGRRVRRLEWCM